MNNFEYITKDIETFKKFINKNDMNLDCTTCKNSGLACGDCTDNLIYYLTLEKEEIDENSISTEDFCKYVNKLKDVLSSLNSAYLNINYLVNHLESLKNEGLKLSENQYKIIEDLKPTYTSNSVMINKLSKVFELIEEMK